MKKLGMMALALLAFGLVVRGEMDDKLYNLTVVANGTNTAAYVLRGLLEAVHVDVQALSTCTVTVTSSDGRTLFTKASITADATYLPRAAVHTTAGAAATFNVYGGTADQTNAYAQTWYALQPMAEAITVSLVGQNAAGAGSTNNTKVRLLYSK